MVKKENLNRNVRRSMRKIHKRRQEDLAKKYPGMNQEEIDKAQFVRSIERIITKLISLLKECDAHSIKQS